VYRIFLAPTAHSRGVVRAYFQLWAFTTHSFPRTVGRRVDSNLFRVPGPQDGGSPENPHIRPERLVPGPERDGIQVGPSKLPKFRSGFRVRLYV
jgi:hypothetical protein